MKHDIPKRLLAVLLSAFILVGPAKALASQGGEETHDASHTHNFVFYANSYTYFEGDSNYHLRGVQPFYRRVCGEMKYRQITWTDQEHTMSLWKYNRNNYHSGAYHYIQHKRSCLYCKYTERIWESYRCPGPGSCILPESLRHEMK